MTRRFREHERRAVQLLDGIWDFEFLGDVELGAVDLARLACSDRLAVPGCFDATPRYARSRGVAVYRRSIPLSEAGRYRLVFQGVHQLARVFVDRCLVGEHAGGFTRFATDLGELSAGEHELVVVVDNRFDPVRCPLHLDYFDWYHYGGIARSVELERLPPTWLKSLAVETLSIDPPRVRICLDYESAEAKSTQEFRILLDGRQLLVEAVAVESAGRIVRVLDLPGAALWSPAEPALHLVGVQLGEDDLRVRIGLRVLEVRRRDLLLNGAPLRLLGVNRHQSYPMFGHALPDSINLADLELIRELGANFVRGAHYPQDPSFLDLCDELGICVWNEAIGWQHTQQHLSDPRFIAAQLGHIEEMVEMSRNHPSVVVWGVLNEGHSNATEARPAYQRLLGRLRELDSTRPVSYASMFGYQDACFDLADIVAVNTYPGWYQHELEDIPAELERLLSHLERTQPDKPVIISELGAAALYGCHELGDGRWTEEYQAQLLELAIRKLFEEDGDRVLGLAIWQFCDARTSDRVNVVMGKPRGYNNKGLLDEYRRPKRAYDRVRRAFRSLAKRA